MTSAAEITARLLDWYDRQQRDLPWRRTTDPWAILVSEIMLQQTRVEVVLDYYPRFLARFPDPARLAAADESEVLGIWSGLGFYARARNLRKAAACITTRHGGVFPSSHEQILALPGVGRYTAGAVASIAFGLPFPVVDGNVARVLARLFLVAGDPRSGSTSRRLWELAEELLDQQRPGDLNQALMELGAVACLPRSPRCLLCPVQDRCAARLAQRIDEFPAPRRRTPPVPVRLIAVLLRRRGEVALVRRAAGGLMAGLLDVPAIEVGLNDDARAATTRWLRDRFGVAVRDLEPVGHAHHTITHRRIAVEVFEATPSGRETAALIREERGAYAPHGIAPEPDEQGLRFVSRESARKLELSALARKILAAGGF